MSCESADYFEACKRLRMKKIAPTTPAPTSKPINAGTRAFVDDEAPEAVLPALGELETLAVGEEFGVGDSLAELVACGVGEGVAVGFGCTVGTGVVTGIPGFGVAGILPPCTVV